MPKNSTTQDDETRWRAIVQKDKRFEREFFYGVKTTGVYCRPGCSSRLPHRANVEFYDSQAQAEQAGYRPCRRCRPNRTESRDEQMRERIIQACRHIEASEHPIKSSELAHLTGLSLHHFHRLFKKIVGVTPKQYSRHHHYLRLHHTLATHRTVTEAIYAAGYHTSSSAYKTIQERLAMQPKTLRNGATGKSITYALARCALGWVIIGVTERGICFLAFDDEPATLVSCLQERFSRAHIERSDAALAPLMEQVLHIISHPDIAHELPLDIQSTAFQARVYTELQKIKPGETASYGEIAARLGQPTASRAVARACATNNIALLIPCHRVIRGDGSLSGYRWGTQRKKDLLKLEEEKTSRKPPK